MKSGTLGRALYNIQSHRHIFVFLHQSKSGGDIVYAPQDCLFFLYHPTSTACTSSFPYILHSEQVGLVASEE